MEMTLASAPAGITGPRHSFLTDSLLPTLVAILLGGAMPFLSYFLRASTWLVWALLAMSLAVTWKRLALGRQLRPLRPYLLWFGIYMVWGLIIATYRDYSFVVKATVTTLLVAGTMASACSSPRTLTRFATAIQFTVMGNLLVLVLANVSGQVAGLIQTVTMRSAEFQAGMSRYGGLWGNPNMAGYVCLVATLVSVFATPWAARLGRLSCLPLLFLSASRKSVLLYLAILLLYFFIVQRRNARFWLGGTVLAVGVALAFSLSTSLRRDTAAVGRNTYMSRLLDVQEQSLAERGGQTRLDLFEDWYATLAQEPWYGYGLQAMAGTAYDEETGAVLRKGLLNVGTHNTYLGVWIDTGPIGFVIFMAMLAVYLRRTLAIRGPAATRWMVKALFLVNAAFLFVSHSHLFAMEGQVAFMLMFLLPTSPAIRDLARGRAMEA